MYGSMDLTMDFSGQITTRVLPIYCLEISSAYRIGIVRRGTFYPPYFDVTITVDICTNFLDGLRINHL